jgi:predicted alpha/beta superfamily hydrolase
VSAPWSPVLLAGAQARTVQASVGGAPYRVQVWLPETAAPREGFPVVYVLDGNALFATFVELVRRSSRRSDATGIVPTAVVAVAPEGEALYDEAARRRDFTFGPSADATAAAAGGAVGGGPAFLHFLRDELAPALAHTFGLNLHRQSLFGHSLAGHFVLRALAARPDAFRTWAAISPSIWWDPAGLGSALATAQAVPADTRVLLAVGQWEEEVPPWQRAHPAQAQLVARRAQRDMVGSARQLASQLPHWLGDATLQFAVFPDEDHASVVMVAAQRLLRLASR